MNKTSVDARWLLGGSLRIGAIILVAFLVGAFVDEAISAFGLSLLYGLSDEIVAVIQYTGIVTAILYAVARATDDNRDGQS